MRHLVKSLSNLLLRPPSGEVTAHLSVDGIGRLHTAPAIYPAGDPVTGADGADLDTPANGLYVTGAGALKFEIVKRDGTRHALTITYAVGDVVPFVVYKVWATGTVATVVAL